MSRLGEMLVAAVVLASAIPVPHASEVSAFDEETLTRLERALSCVNLSISDLGWDKRPISDDFRLSCVNETLDHPLLLADRALRAEAEFAGDPLASAKAAEGWLKAAGDGTNPNTGDHEAVPSQSTPSSAEKTATGMASEHSGVDSSRVSPGGVGAGQANHDSASRIRFGANDRPASVTPERFRGAPPDAAALLALLTNAYRNASHLREQAMAGLSSDERRILRESGARLYSEESDEDWDMTATLAAAKKVDVSSLIRAEQVLAEAARDARERIGRRPEHDLPASSRWKTRSWTVDGVTVGLGGPGRDTHTETVVLDGGGDDLYTGGSVIVDLAGDDHYKDAAQGLFDVALVLDLTGNDTYSGKNFVQGGTAFGASLLIDVEGDDHYDADQCSQGAAFFGVGMLFDLAGSDSYRGARFVQGFGGTRGLGALSDLSGNDTYYAGGKYSHAPLLPENFQSLSQGFGFGLRGASASGGIGILADHAGNDIYSAEVFGQGASYWFSLGILVDSVGHDKYNLYQYGQGAGIHLSAGVLLDRAGNDAYSCNNGVAQGSGHDWGVGLLWDLAGDDCYQGSGMSQGGANANGIGMLVDRSGNDSYSGWNEKNQGDSFFARGTIGLGVLLDLAGKDRYTHGGADGAIWTRGTVGVGYDVEEPAATDGKATEKRP